jgi:hypothetical protein
MVGSLPYLIDVCGDVLIVSIPIAFSMGDDWVSPGVVVSFNRLGSNITGVRGHISGLSDALNRAQGK